MIWLILLAAVVGGLLFWLGFVVALLWLAREIYRAF